MQLELFKTQYSRPHNPLYTLGFSVKASLMSKFGIRESEVCVVVTEQTVDGKLEHARVELMWKKSSHVRLELERYHTCYKADGERIGKDIFFKIDFLTYSFFSRMVVAELGDLLMEDLKLRLFYWVTKYEVNNSELLAINTRCLSNNSQSKTVYLTCRLHYRPNATIFEFTIKDDGKSLELGTVPLEQVVGRRPEVVAERLRECYCLSLL